MTVSSEPSGDAIDPIWARSAALAGGFRAALSALSEPGRIIQTAPLAAHPIPGVSDAAANLLLILSDADAPWWLAPRLATPETARRLTFETGVSGADDPRAAAFLVGAWADLAAGPVDAAAIGDPEYPDRGTTLIVEATSIASERAAAGEIIAGEQGASARLSGPGLARPCRVALDLGGGRDSADFWRWMVANTARFPLGLDVFVCAGDQLLGLPRSLTVAPE